jgi:hypothetical protein
MMSKVRTTAIGAVLAAAGLQQQLRRRPRRLPALRRNLGDELFNKAGTTTKGLGVLVKNNAASAHNNWTFPATVFYNSGCNGSVASQTFGAYSSGNFNSTMKNQFRVESAELRDHPGHPAGHRSCGVVAVHGRGRLPVPRPASRDRRPGVRSRPCVGTRDSRRHPGRAV